MNQITLLKLLNVMVSLSDDERETIAENILFDNIRNMIAKDADYIKVGDKKVCVKQLKSTIGSIEQSTLDYLSGITCTNKGMSRFISRVLDKEQQTDPVKIASTLTAIGNNDTVYDCPNGIDKLKAHIKSNTVYYYRSIDDNESYQHLNIFANNLYLYTVLSQILCTFMVAKFGSESGVPEHFGVNVLEIPLDFAKSNEELTDNFDVVENIEGAEQLALFDHYQTLITGIESFINADKYPTETEQTEAQRYTIGVMLANDLFKAPVEGLEGALWDKAKAGFTKVLKVIRDGLVALKTNYLDKSIDEIADDVKEAADANKKALNAIQEKDAVLTDSAKAGITKLAENTNNEQVKSAISGLSNVGNASSTIDKLLSVFTTVYNETQSLQGDFNKVDANLKALENQTTASGPDDDDKQALSVQKEAISEKSKEVRDQFDELKKKLADQRKAISAIAKAIKGITPSIFYAKKEETTND